MNFEAQPNVGDQVVEKEQSQPVAKTLELPAENDEVAGVDQVKLAERLKEVDNEQKEEIIAAYQNILNLKDKKNSTELEKSEKRLERQALMTELFRVMKETPEQRAIRKEKVRAKEEMENKAKIDEVRAYLHAIPSVDSKPGAAASEAPVIGPEKTIAAVTENPDYKELKQEIDLVEDEVVKKRLNEALNILPPQALGFLTQELNMESQTMGSLNGADEKTLNAVDEVLFRISKAPTAADQKSGAKELVNYLKAA